MRVILHQTKHLLNILPECPKIVVSPLFSPFKVKLVQPKLLITSSDNPNIYRVSNYVEIIKTIPNLHIKAYFMPNFFAISTANLSNADLLETTLIFSIDRLKEIRNLITYLYLYDYLRNFYGDVIF